jgi:hypothetical protein
MPVGIARRRIAQHRITKRSIGGKYSVENLQTPYQFPPGSYSFVVPKSGYWKLVAWAAGESGTNAGASGGYGEITKPLFADQVVSIQVGTPGGATSTVLTFPDGTIATATGGLGTVGGTATNFDVGLNGSAGDSGAGGPGNAGNGSGGGMGGTGSPGSGAGGGGAPGILPFRGGKGGSGLGAGAQSPGGGCGNSTIPVTGGSGLALVFLIKE